MPNRRRAAQLRAAASPRRQASPTAVPFGTAPRRRAPGLRRLAPLGVSILVIGVVSLLAWLGGKARTDDQLVTDLGDRNASTRANAAYQLSLEKHPSVSALKALARLLGDDEDEPRGEAVAALISLG